MNESNTIALREIEAANDQSKKLEGLLCDLLDTACVLAFAHDDGGKFDINQFTSVMRIIKKELEELLHISMSMRDHLYEAGDALEPPEAA